MNHVLCSIGQMDVGIYGVELLKVNTLQPLPEQCWLEHYGLAFSGFTHHCGRHDESIQVYIRLCRPCPSLYVHCFSLGWWHLPAGQCEVSNSWQCTCLVRRALA
ncbi:hypothetical protein TNCV_1172391 [Trichonephila clavipes]|uniref:Uncharacterized protein n=1 Tax=Trichonephila clavipes TaxID=2585209 RepID=A0A8X6VDB9_TRICX|nr:hypothetical protein TNCV_1172391 [Trichonephila clavipes]